MQPDGDRSGAAEGQAAGEGASSTQVAGAPAVSEPPPREVDEAPDSGPLPSRAPLWASARFRLALFVGLTTLMVAGTFDVVAFDIARETVRHQVHDGLGAVARERRDSIDTYVEHQHGRMALITNRNSLRSLLQQHRDGLLDDGTLQTLLDPSLADLQTSFDDIVGALIASPKGRVLASTEAGRRGESLGGAPYFVAGRERPYLGEPELTNNVYRAHLAGPLRDRAGALAGVVVLRLDISPLFRLVTDVPRIGSSGEVLLVAGSGADRRALFRPRLPSSARLLRASFEEQAPDGSPATVERNGGKTLASYLPLHHLDWAVIAKTEADEAYAPIEQMRLAFLVVTGLLALAGLLFGYLSARRFTQPLLDITDSAMAIARGEPGARLDYRARDEIGVLAAALRRMRGRLEQHQEQLEATVQKRTAALLASRDQLAAEIAEREVLEGDLRQAKEAAEGAAEAKSSFLATMSHEIRTPMSAVISAAELMAGTRLDQEQRDYLTMIRDSAESLLGVIDDILDFSRIEAGRLELRPYPFDLRATVDSAVKALEVRARADGLDLSLRVAPEVPAVVVGDPSRLRQILLNLVGNAVKFTHEGGVTVAVGAVPEEDGPDRVRFNVTDTGPGIPPEQQAHIFDAFVQGDSSLARRHGGTGLGLAITSRLVELMGGCLWLDSEVGHGSTFHFVLPLPEASKEQLDLARRPDLAGMRVLVADAAEPRRDALVEMVESWRMRAGTVAGTAAMVEALAEAVRAGDPVRLVLVDAVLVEQADHWVLDEIGRDENLGRPAIVAIFATADRVAEARLRERGGATVLSRPVTRSQLLQAIDEARGGALPRPEPPSPSPAALGRPLHILLAEDSPVNRKLATALLEGWGYTVVGVQNGREALREYRKQSFDLVLMDVQMPVMDGLHATEHIRSIEEKTGAHVPIIAMTAHAMRGDRERCLAAGMTDYVSKPVHAEDLRRVIAKNATRREVAHLEAEALDWQRAVERLGGDEEVLLDAGRAMLLDCPRRLADVEDALAQSDAGRLAAAAHAIKGEVQVFTSGALAESAGQLETLARAGRLAEATEMWSPLRAGVEHLMELLRTRTAPPEEAKGD